MEAYIEDGGNLMLYQHRDYHYVFKTDLTIFLSAKGGTFGPNDEKTKKATKEQALAIVVKYMESIGFTDGAIASGNIINAHKWELLYNNGYSLYNDGDLIVSFRNGEWSQYRFLNSPEVEDTTKVLCYKNDVYGAMLVSPDEKFNYHVSVIGLNVNTTNPTSTNVD
jgi:hypothetical protein